MRRGLATLAVLAFVLPLRADLGAPPEVPYENTPYNGKFSFARLKFRPSQWGPGQYEWGLDLKWNHDYPRGETHFTKILEETTSIQTNPRSNIIGLDDPELFKYPFAYMCEVGFLTLQATEARNLRAYLQKGGFLILDDFIQRDLLNLEIQMHEVLPDARFIEVPREHGVWDSFFKIEEPPRTHPYRTFLRASYLGIFEDNDPQKRLLVLANYNNDIGEYWEFSDTGFVPIDLSNEAYKLGVNYVIYAMTH